MSSSRRGKANLSKTETIWVSSLINLAAQKILIGNLFCSVNKWHLWASQVPKHLASGCARREYHNFQKQHLFDDRQAQDSIRDLRGIAARAGLRGQIRSIRASDTKQHTPHSDCWIAIAWQQRLSCSIRGFKKDLWVVAGRIGIYGQRGEGLADWRPECAAYLGDADQNRGIPSQIWEVI